MSEKTAGGTSSCPFCGHTLGVHEIGCVVLRNAAKGDSHWATGMRAIHQFLDNGTDDGGLLAEEPKTAGGT